MNNIKKPLNSVQTYVKDVNANDRIVVPGRNTVLLVLSKRTSDNYTTINYTFPGETDKSMRFTFTVVNLSTVYLITD